MFYLKPDDDAVDLELRQTMGAWAAAAPDGEAGRERVWERVSGAGRRPRRSWPRYAFAASLLLALALGAFNPVEIGSDAFDIELAPWHPVVEGEEIDIYTSPFSGSRGSILGDRDEPMEERLVRTEDFWAQLELGAHPLVEIDGWRMGREKKFAASYEISDNPDVSIASKTIVEPSEKMVREYWPFYDLYGLTFMIAARRGEIPPSGTETHHMLGRDYVFQKYVHRSPEFGEVIYLRWQRQDD